MAHRKSFKDWLEDNRRAPIVGPLAQEILEDEAYPWASPVADMRCYLVASGATVAQLRVFDTAVALYETFIGVRLFYIGGPADGAPQRFEVNEPVPERQIVGVGRLREWGVDVDVEQEGALLHVYRRVGRRYVHAGAVKADTPSA